MLGHNNPGGLLENVPYYKFAIAHCARRVHTPQMYRESLAIKENAEHRYDKLWDFRSFMTDFFKIVKEHKGISRDIDIDEILKKASSKKGRNFFNFYRLKNNDYGFIFFGLHGRLAEPVDGHKGAGLCHNLIPEAFFHSGPWGYYGKGFDVAMQLLHGPYYCLRKGHMIGMDNRYTSPDLFIHLNLCQTNAFGTVRNGRMYLPDEANRMYDEAKELRPGEYLSMYSEI